MEKKEYLPFFNTLVRPKKKRTAYDWNVFLYYVLMASDIFIELEMLAHLCKRDCSRDVLIFSGNVHVQALRRVLPLLGYQETWSCPKPVKGLEQVIDVRSAPQPFFS